ncbi:MAG: hypothetical protein N3I35_07885 [Clostridia bacterium]|nr:hypothetical protein [Clostridia bacterium]
MALGKREKILLVVLGILIYVLIAVKFVWIPIIPKISEKNDQLIKITMQKQALDNDRNSIENKKNEISALKITNEKIGYLLMDQANITDSIEYIEKLSALLGRDLEGINILAPVERSYFESLVDSSDKKNSKDKTEKTKKEAGFKGTKFYEFGISFSTKLDYAKIVELLNYLECGSKKVRVSYFKMIPFEEEKKEKGKQQKNGLPDLAKDIGKQINDKELIKEIERIMAELEKKINSDKKLFQIDMTINLYAMKIGTIDKLFEYSRHKFSTYTSGNGLPYIPSKKAAGTASSLAGNTGGSDISISLNSFLTAGDNLNISGINKSSEYLSVKTKENSDIRVTVKSSSYSIETRDSNGKPVRISGTVPARDINISISADFPAVKDNNSLGMNITVVNDSGRNLNITLSDNSRRVNLYNENGSNIYSGSPIDKIFVK